MTDPNPAVTITFHAEYRPDGPTNVSVDFRVDSPVAGLALAPKPFPDGTIKGRCRFQVVIGKAPHEAVPEVMSKLGYEYEVRLNALLEALAGPQRLAEWDWSWSSNLRGGPDDEVVRYKARTWGKATLRDE